MSKEFSLKKRWRVFTPEERAELVAEYERSGKTRAAFVRQHGISLASLSNWLREHRKKPAKDKAPVFQAVDLSGMMGGPQWTMEVVLPDGTAIRLGSERDAGLAERMIQVLRGPC